MVIQNPLGEQFLSSDEFFAKWTKYLDNSKWYCLRLSNCSAPNSNIFVVTLYSKALWPWLLIPPLAVMMHGTDTTFVDRACYGKIPRKVMLLSVHPPMYLRVTWFSLLYIFRVLNNRWILSPASTLECQAYYTYLLAFWAKWYFISCKSVWWSTHVLSLRICLVFHAAFRYRCLSSVHRKQQMRHCFPVSSHLPVRLTYYLH